MKKYVRIINHIHIAPSTTMCWASRESHIHDAITALLLRPCVEQQESYLRCHHRTTLPTMRRAAGVISTLSSQHYSLDHPSGITQESYPLRHHIVLLRPSVLQHATNHTAHSNFEHSSKVKSCICTRVASKNCVKQEIGSTIHR